MIPYPSGVLLADRDTVCVPLGSFFGLPGSAIVMVNVAVNHVRVGLLIAVNVHAIRPPVVVDTIN